LSPSACVIFRGTASEGLPSKGQAASGLTVTNMTAFAMCVDIWFYWLRRMVKTEMRIVYQRDPGMDADLGTPRLLEDLNGRTAPHGLVRQFRDLLRVVDYNMNFTHWAPAYLRLLRGYVDLWLATGCKAGVDTPGTRHPTTEISRIVEDVVIANRVLPATMKDGYAMVLTASPRPVTRGSKASRDEAFARNAAQVMFVAMLMSDERLKIAKCVGQGCGTYFQLGKWNQRYEHGTRCPICREGQERGDKQGRVEANRAQAKRALYAYVAQRFARRIVPGRPWYLNTGLKAEVATAINNRFEGDLLVRALYPKALTSKWLVAGRAGTKNWQLIEHAKLRPAG
jgi:hypothetical protein